MKKQWISILIVGMSFGTAWAIRGQFGHEPGAAWAAMIGALALVLVAQRNDWYAKIVPVAFSSAVGWGAGGMISYGMVVGYGRTTDLLNTAYGLLMLFVIGGLYGLLGGGLTGLTLDSSKNKGVNWGGLMAEMTAGGLIGYYFLIEQAELLMTPPRSEAWAVSLGAGIAMIWHLVRNNHRSPLRVAFYSAMGAGFGFAFGNFLQLLGDVMQIKFNTWNIMEYSIGFFGGSAMAYGVFTSEWSHESAAPERWENKTTCLLAFIVIPFLVFVNSDLIRPFFKGEANISAPDNGSLTGSIIAAVLVISVAVIGWVSAAATRKDIGRKVVYRLFVLWFTTYIFLSFGVTGAFRGVIMLNHQLYVVNFIIVMILIAQRFPAFHDRLTETVDVKKWLQLAVGIVIFIIIFALIAINIHGDIGGANYRFKLN